MGKFRICRAAIKSDIFIHSTANSIFSAGFNVLRLSCFYDFPSFYISRLSSASLPFFLFSSPSHERFTKSACRKIKGGSSWYISLIKGENKIINISPMQKIHCTTPTRLGIFIHIFSLCLRHVCATSVKKFIDVYARRIYFAGKVFIEM